MFWKLLFLNRLGKKLINDNHSDGKQHCEVMDETGVE